MADAKSSSASNDEALFRAVDSGNISNVVRLLRQSRYNITALFSDNALNWTLTRACHSGHAALIQLLAEDVTRLEARDETGNTPLLICSEKGMADTVKMLLAQGADVNAANNKGDSAIMLAKSSEVIHHLLNHRCLDVNRQNVDGYTALMVAIETHSLHKVQLLINSCPKNPYYGLETKQINFSLLSKRGESALQIANRVGLGPLVEILYHAHINDQHPLMLAAVNGLLKCCDLLLSYDLVDGQEVVNIRPNILCVVLNVIKDQTVPSGGVETDLIRRLCEAGVDANSCSDCTRSPLDIVLDIGSYDLAEVLCQHGAVVPHEILVSLVEKSNIDFIELFAKYGAEMNQSDESGCFKYRNSALDVALKDSKIGCASALFYHGSRIDVEYAVSQAVYSSNSEILKFLTDHCQAELKKILKTKRELFNKAVTLGNLDILNSMLKAGADVNGICCDKTPLMSAVHPDVVRCLLKNGADVNIKTSTTAMIHAVSSVYIANVINTNQSNCTAIEPLKTVKEILSLLIENGAEMETTNDEGNTVLIESVRNMCHRDIVQMLLNNGSYINARNRDGQTALNTAMHFRTSGLANDILNMDWCPFLDYVFSNQRTTAIVSYTADRCLELVKLLLENHADINIADNAGNNPLLNACVDRLIEGVKFLVLLVPFVAIVNYTNESGMSALMMAANDKDEHWVSVLLNLGADVNFTSDAGPRSKTALSILLNKWYPNSLSQRLALKLLDRGATTQYVRRDVIHRMTALNKSELVRRLIASGLGPSDVVLKMRLSEWPYLTISPLAVCILRDNLSLAKYYMDHWYLTQSDIKLLSRDSAVLQHVNSDSHKFLTEASAQPMRLQVLSFISVSSSIGPGSDREEKIQSLPLPRILKEYLMFRNVTEGNLLEVAGSQYHDEYDGLRFINRLTRRQIIKEDSDFYQKDLALSLF